MGLREELSLKYLKGEGIEIGALQKPLKVGRLAHVTYVDRCAKQELVAHYPELDPALILEPDIICDGATLEAVGDASLDFVIANHLLEHMADPLKALENWIRVLRSGGILYMTVPDMLRTFDVDRPLTSIEHMIEDNCCSAKRDPRLDYVHYLEWVIYAYPRFHRPLPMADVYQEAHRLQTSNYSIHFHTFVEHTAEELVALAENRYGVKTLESHNDQESNELIWILRRL